MAVGFPAKTSFADGNPLPASDLNDITGTLNTLTNGTFTGTLTAGTVSGTTVTAGTLNATTVNGTTWSQTGGLQFIKKQTVGSAVSSVAVSSAFSSTYDDYKIVYEGFSAASTPCQLQFIMTGTSSGYYSSGTYQSAASSTVVTWNLASGSVWSCGIAGNLLNRFEFDLASPFLSAAKSVNFRYAAYDNTNSTGGQGYGLNIGSASSTGFTISTNGTTITGGTIYVYGYAKV